MFIFSYLKKSVVFFVCITVALTGICWSIAAQCQEPDKNPPAINEVKAESCYLLSLSFNEALDKSTAEAAANYMVNDSIGAATVSSLSMDCMKVTLRFSTPFQKNRVYNVVISNVKDISGNTINTTRKSFVSTYTITQDMQSSQNQNLIVTKSKAIDKKTVVINFAAKLDRETAEKAENYYIVDADINVKSVVLSEDRMSVTVSLPDGLTKDYKYCILIRNIKDNDRRLMNTGAALFIFPPVVATREAKYFDSHKDLMFSYNHNLKVQYEKEKLKGDENAVRAIENQLEFVRKRFKSDLRGLYELEEYWKIDRQKFDMDEKNPGIKTMRPDCIAVKGSMLKPTKLPVRKDDLFYIASDEIVKISGIRVDVNTKDQKVVITKNTTTIEMQVGNTTAIINGKLEEAGVSPIVVSDTIYLPLQYIGEKLGYTVELKREIIWQGDILLLDDTIYQDK